MHRKCHHCGISDSTHAADFGKSQLVEAMGPTDTDGLQMWFVYCRKCKHMNIYKPGWLMNLKHSYTWSAIQIMKFYPPARALAEVESVPAIVRPAQMRTLAQLDSVLEEDNLI